MKSRIDAASSRPEGPVVREAQSMSMDITWLGVWGGGDKGWWEVWRCGGAEEFRGGVGLVALLGHCTLLSVADRWSYRITGLGIWSIC